MGTIDHEKVLVGNLPSKSLYEYCFHPDQQCWKVRAFLDEATSFRHTMRFIWLAVELSSLAAVCFMRPLHLELFQPLLLLMAHHVS